MENVDMTDYFFALIEGNIFVKVIKYLVLNIDRDDQEAFMCED